MINWHLYLGDLDIEMHQAINHPTTVPHPGYTIDPHTVIRSAIRMLFRAVVAECGAMALSDWPIEFQSSLWRGN
jgi:hypothetical protein